jgi:hypothetical protein
MDDDTSMGGETITTVAQSAINEANAKRVRLAEVQHSEEVLAMLDKLEPDAKAYYLATQEFDQALQLSIAISTRRSADAPAATGSTEWKNRVTTEDDKRTADFTHEGEWTTVREQVADDVHARNKKGTSGDNKKTRGGYKGRGRDVGYKRDKVGDKPKSATGKRKAKRKKGAIKTPFD